MKKILILLTFLGLGLVSGKVQAYCYGYSCGGYGYGYGYGGYYYKPTKMELAYFATNNFFWAVNSAMDAAEDLKAMENNLAIRRQNLENSKSVQNYYNGTIVPFAPIAPNGKPRPPQITWKDVESIRWE